MQKSALRKLYKQKRSALSGQKIDELSKKIALHFCNHFEPVDVTHVFMPIKKLKEVNTAFIIDQLHHNDLVTCTSVSDFNTGTMSSIAFTEETEFTTTQFGIPEPIGGPVIDEQQIDRVIVPLLACDTFGNRVGYGKGFYDRFLALCRPDVEKIALSFFELTDDISDCIESDIRMNACVTSKEVFHFT